MEKIKRKCDLKLINAVIATEDWLNKHREYPSVDDNLNFTVEGCERCNLKTMKRMLQTKVVEWSREEKELYKAL
jgi:hypothetical protein